MHILSVTLRNYRLHRELNLDFDSGRTLIGGPNESGKSTLIEAIHRALFLNAKGNTAHHRAMISSSNPGNPEVELCFHAGGITYTLRKRFGTNGTVSLSPSNAEALAGPAAEAELAKILAAQEDLNAASQWGHLWVWQGKAGEDPSGHATERQGELIQRLQQMGGDTPLQSGLDTSLADHFKAAVGEIFTLAGHPKAGSSLAQTETALSVANEELNQARAHVEKLETWAAEFESTSRSLLETEAIQATLSKQQEEIESKALLLAGLRQQETEYSHGAKETAARHKAMENANKQILLVRKDIELLVDALKPKEETIALLETALAQAKQNASIAEQAHNEASMSVGAARMRLELSQAFASLFASTELHAKLTQKSDKISSLRRGIGELEEQLAKLPKVEKDILRKVQDLDAKYSKATAALKAMATGLEVIASDQAVRAGGNEIAPGLKQILTEDTEICIGSSIRIQIQPGGGTSLADARLAESEAQTKLRKTLDALGIKSVPEAVEANGARADIAARIKAGHAELKGMGEESFAAEYQKALNELSAAKANVERISPMASEVNAPADLAAAEALAREFKRKLTELESGEASTKARREAAIKAQQAADESLQIKRTETTEQRSQLTGLKANHDLLCKNHGEDDARTRALIDAQTSKIAAETRLKLTLDAIAAMEPELLEGDRERIKRAIQQKVDELTDIRTRKAVARESLRSDGSQDPRAALAAAQARAQAAGERQSIEKRRAGALRLLDQLFQEEQRTLADQFAKPLAEKISGYLQCIFGPGAQAQVALDNNAFSGLQISHSGTGAAVFGFEKLSGGAKEQVAAAYRLAMAELLAADFDGCLPIVFDDAFAYSDPERVNKLQRMLDLAASRGLQIIVLTCTPLDYAGLGAKQVILERVRPASSASYLPTDIPAANGSNEESFTITGPDSADVESTILTASFTRIQSDQLLSQLRDLGGKSGNMALRESLGWDEPTYTAVKTSLILAAKLISGRGKGGSVSLPVE